MATNLTVTLSETLQNTLSSTTNGSVGIWAVYFTNGGKTPHAVKLEVEGGNHPKPATEIALPNPYDGGKIYLLIQSIDPGNHASPAALTFGATGVIKTESDISWNNASTNQYRFDSFELSLLGAAADAGNLTDVNVFGIPMSVEISYPNGAAAQTRGYEVTGNTIFNQIGSAFTTDGGLIHKYEYGPLATHDRLAAAPTTALATGGPGGASASDWYSYLESLGNQIAGSIQVAGQYNGAATVEYVVGQASAAGNYTNWHNPAFYSYAVSYEKAPATIYSASAKLGAQPFESNGTTAAPSNAITVTDPNARHYTNNVTKVTFTDATAFSVFSAADLNASHTVVNVIDDSHYQIIVGTTNATTKVAGGGTNVVTAVPLGDNPFSAVAGQKLFTVTDPGASHYANEGAEVSFTGAAAFAGFTEQYLNGTKFTIAKVIDATRYQVATATEAQTGTGGGASVAPTYVRPEAGVFVFTPEDNSQVKGTIKISSADLANSIYSTLGNAQILSPDGTPYSFTGLNSQNIGIATTGLNTGFNTEWGAFFVKLLTGFIGGYYGGTGEIANKWTGGPSNVDLNVNWNFDPSYAFSSTTKTPWTPDALQFGNGVTFDKYAQIFFDSTNSYGNGYSDAVMSLFEQGGPLMPTGYAVPLGNNPFSTTQGSNIVTVHDANATAYGYKVGDLVTFAGGTKVAGIDMLAPPVLADTSNKAAWTIHSLVTGGYTIDVGRTTANATISGGGGGVVAGYDVPAIHLTLFDDNEPAAAGKTLAETQGYTPTAIFNSHAGPFVESTGPGHSQNLELDFGLGIGQMRPASGLTVSLGFFAGAGAVAGESKFTYVKFDTTKTESLFQKWTYDSTTKTLTPAGQAAPTGVALSVSGLPYATGVNWYQLVFDDGTPAHKRTYNIYLDALAGHGVRNPAYIGTNQQGSVAIDGLASFTGLDTAPST